MTAVEIGSQRHKAFGSRPRRWLPGRELADLSLTVTATPRAAWPDPGLAAVAS